MSRIATALAACTLAMAMAACQTHAAAGAAETDGARHGSYVERARDLAVSQPGPHDGAGTTTAYPFFEQAAGFDVVFRQRALHPGASIGEHRNDKDEIYYVLSGRGRLMLDGNYRDLAAGDAVLTRDGSTHGLQQVGDENLVIIVVFRRPVVPPPPR